MFSRFYEENIERDVKSFVSKNEIYSHYLKYCEFYNLKPLSKNSLTFYLNNLRTSVSHRKQLKGEIVFGRQGVRLKPCQYSL